jgi:putative DNA primase/helicase
VVILDNVSCLFSGISEDRKQDWEPINAWLVRLRHRGLSVILIHHAGKTGQQRGTSGREDALDTVIALDWPPNYDPREGCRFYLRFTKSRSVKGDAVTPLEVKLEDNGDTTVWQAQPLDQSRLEQVCQLLAQDISRVTDIAEELGITKGYASKLKKRAEQDDMGIVL